MSNYQLIFVCFTISYGVILAAIFIPIASSSQLSTVDPNSSENHKIRSGIASSLNSSTAHIRLDKFGIKEIYPTKQGGREWYINMKKPANDSLFTIGTGKNDNITRQSDGSWRIAYQKVRMSVDTPPGTPMWKNVEITGYAKVDSIRPFNNKNLLGDAYYTDLAWFARR